MQGEAANEKQWLSIGYGCCTHINDIWLCSMTVIDHIQKHDHNKKTDSNYIRHIWHCMLMAKYWIWQLSKKVKSPHCQHALTPLQPWGWCYLHLNSPVPAVSCKHSSVTDDWQATACPQRSRADCIKQSEVRPGFDPVLALPARLRLLQKRSI